VNNSLKKKKNKADEHSALKILRFLLRNNTELKEGQQQRQRGG